MKQPIRILLVDDHPALRRALADRLEQERGFKVIGQAADGSEAVQLAQELRPHVIVMDIAMPVRERIRQRDAVSSLEKLKAHIEKTYAEGIARKQSFRELDQLSRNTQDMIFDGRSRNPLFFDFIYRWLRPDHELRMNEKAKEMVEDTLAKRGQWKE